MKQLITLLLLSSMAKAQYVPKQVETMLYEVSNDTIITYENYRYTYKFSSNKINDSLEFITWKLTNKEKLFYRPYTALGVEAFAVTMGSMVFFSSVNYPKDKKLHALAGFYISGISSTAMYYWTGKKWASSLVGFGVGCLAGIAKEAIWDKAMDKGNCSNNDAYVTMGGAFAAALTVRITLR